MKTAGITGCRAGWFAIGLDDSNEGSGYHLLESQEQLAEFLEGRDRVFVNVPIGLQEDTHVRTCDELLRKRLGPDYTEEIVDPPVRAAMAAPTYAEASMNSYEITGAKISTRAWNQTPYIRQLDQLLQQDLTLREKVFESHPELVFQILNGGRSVLQKKQTKKGVRHRLDLMKKNHELVGDFFRDIKEGYRRNQIGESDIVDGLALALEAYQSRERPIQRLPKEPEQDSTGLIMAIHYVT